MAGLFLPKGSSDKDFSKVHDNWFHVWFEHQTYKTTLNSFILYLIASNLQLSSTLVWNNCGVSISPINTHCLGEKRWTSPSSVLFLESEETDGPFDNLHNFLSGWIWIHIHKTPESTKDNVVTFDSRRIRWNPDMGFLVSDEERTSQEKLLRPC